MTPATVTHPMTIQRRFINLFDRPGLRWILANLTTFYARQKTGLDLRVFYEDAWVRRVSELYLAESPTFPWYASKIAGWKPSLGEVLDMYRDWWFYKYQPKEGDVVVDIGAGIGDDALVFSKAVGKGGRVLSVEAHPTTFALLLKNCQYNHLSNVTCVHSALMDKPGTVYIDDRPDYKGSTVSESGNAHKAHAVTACSLDELCERAGVNQIDFLKMNIEGAEQFAIRGMNQIINHTEHVCIACHDFIGKQGDFYRTKALITQYLQDRGFEVAFRPEHPDPWVRDHAYAIRKHKL